MCHLSFLKFQDDDFNRPDFISARAMARSDDESDDDLPPMMKLATANNKQKNLY